jgi:hypothetical protein
MDVAELKAEIQRIAWTTDPKERDRLRVLKRKLYRRCCGDMANWRHIQGDFEDYADHSDDLEPYHDMADTLSREDSF